MVVTRYRERERHSARNSLGGGVAAPPLQITGEGAFLFRCLLWIFPKFHFDRLESGLFIESKFAIRKILKGVDEGPFRDDADHCGCLF